MKRTLTFAILVVVLILALITVILAFDLARTMPENAKTIIEVIVEGLEDGQTAELRLLPDTIETSDRLQSLDIELPTWKIRNGTKKIAVGAFPTGAYQLVIDASETYYREPMGYLFRLSDAGIVNPSNIPLFFRLVPPSAQNLPPCRGTGAGGIAASPVAPLTDIPLDESIVSCRAERLVDISSSPKNPEQSP